MKRFYTTKIDIGLFNKEAFSDHFEQECQSDGVWVDPTFFSYIRHRDERGSGTAEVTWTAGIKTWHEIERSKPEKS